MRLICVRDKSQPFLVIKTIQAPYQPQLEQQKSVATSVRYLWQVIDTDGANNVPRSLVPHLQQTLDHLQEQLSAHTAAQQATKRQERERRDFIRIWGSVLSYLKDQLDAIPQLSYASLSYDEESVVFRSLILHLMIFHGLLIRQSLSLLRSDQRMYPLWDMSSLL